MKITSRTTALVTGASRGLGRAYATELARRGADLVLVARSETALTELADELGGRHGIRAEVIAADLADRDAPRAVVGELDARGVTVDLLVNNAGLGAVGPFLERPLDRQLLSVEVNVLGLTALSHLLGGRMRERGSGVIVNVASTAAFQPMPYQASYAATKAFVLSLSEALAVELRGSGVRVVTAHPGAIATGFFDGTTATMDPRVTDAPDFVARRTIDDLERGRVNSYPGRALMRVMTWLPRLLPRDAVGRITGRLNRHLGLHLAS
ncbi:SDR family NAD(P)-dependent oxidoreductase [Nocardiopsis halotolerans]|uniref:SDR family NAD(P)-dependent oxidoreductase n=1 Tax=Nocardiopsis halotolerans TaxID=124252 RepID=UPI0003493685|nr:SDR family oxidoreductase [Nocardiopsis halotolerans]